MDRNEEGGVCTQKIIKIMGMLTLVLVVTACLISTPVSAATDSHSINGDTFVVEAKEKLEFDIIYSTDFEGELEITYTAKLVDSSGSTQSNAVSPSSGSLVNSISKMITITAPESNGKYTLIVEYKITKDETKSDAKDSIILTVKKPIVLSINITNNGEVDMTNHPVFFYVDGNKLEDSRTLVTVAAGAVTTVTYDWVPGDISRGAHTFKVAYGEESDLTVLGESTFYVGSDDYMLAIVLMAILFIIILIIAIYVYRKPVKNYGKPKARR